MLSCRSEPVGIDGGVPDGGCHTDLATGVACLSTGPVIGASTGAHARFLGVRYAHAPRWASPTPATSTDALPARDTARPCAQADVDGGVLGEEDCLRANVWAPLSPAAGGAPVVVFLHGGDNISGSIGDGLPLGLVYDGSAFAELGAVVVTLQYRLGVFGFLAHPALADAGAPGNFALLDLIAGLQWVRQNAPTLGGDADRILLVGQSAGADDVCALMAAPAARGLFAAALMLSGGGCATVTPEVARATAGYAADAVGCTGADVAGCLRATSTQALISVPGNSLYVRPTVPARFYVSVDGVVLSDTPRRLLALQPAPIPVVASTTSEEYSEIVAAVVSAPVTDQASFHNAVVALYGTSGASFVEQQYPIADYPSALWALIAALGDEVFHCPNRRLTRELQDAGYPTRRVLFGHAPSDAMRAPYGAAHGFDVPFVFGNFVGQTTTAAEQQLGAQLRQSYFDVAATLTPSPLASVAFPSGAASLLLVDTPPSVITGWRDTQCDAWEAFGLP
jgi:para-nitrobenzyl esterase